MKKFLKTYWPFATNVMKSNFAYKASFYLYILVSLLSVFITYFLWMAIYGSSSSPSLGGLTKNEMVVYIFMSYVASELISISIANEIGNNIVEGSIANSLIRPIDYRISLLFRAIGVFIYRLFIPCLFIWIGIEAYRVVGLGLPFTGIIHMLQFLFSSILSFLIYVFFDYCFGMLAFYTTYLFGMGILKNVALAFLTGQLIPLSFFPEGFQRVFDYLPFASMNYVPVMIYLGKYSANELVIVLLKQLAWIVILYSLGSFLWSKITKRLIVLGG